MLLAWGMPGSGTMGRVQPMRIGRVQPMRMGRVQPVTHAREAAPGLDEMNNHFTSVNFITKPYGNGNTGLTR